MSYSLKLHPPVESEFPAPPQWLVWVEDTRQVFDKVTRTYSSPPEREGKGQVRHVASLQKAKKYVGQYAWSGTWAVNWRIYEWTSDRYVERFRGAPKDRKADHPLFQTLVRKDEAVRDVPDDEVEAAIASIVGTST